MRFVAVAADVAMGVFVGIFLFALLTRFWPQMGNPFIAALVIVSSILIVLFRRPGGALAPRRDHPGQAPR
jgi:hypothetical protein